MICWKIKVSNVGILVWENLTEAREDYRSWRENGHWCYFYPVIMRRSKFESLKEFRGL